MPPAARFGDITSHGGTLIGPGAPTVFIGGAMAAVAGDLATCPMQAPPVPHGAPLVLIGSATVFIGGRSAARMGDLLTPPCAAIIAAGAPTVQIGG